jgi:hypothetical protein
VQCAGDAPEHVAKCGKFSGRQIVDRGAVTIEDDNEPAENLGRVSMLDNPMRCFENTRGVRQRNLAANRTARLALRIENGRVISHAMMVVRRHTGCKPVSAHPNGSAGQSLRERRNLHLEIRDAGFGPRY